VLALSLALVYAVIQPRPGVPRLGSYAHNQHPSNYEELSIDDEIAITPDAWLSAMEDDHETSFPTPLNPLISLPGTNHFLAKLPDPASLLSSQTLALAPLRSPPL